MTHESVQTMNALSIFPEILSELSANSCYDQDVRHKLKFVKTSILPYDEVESSLDDYLKTSLTEDDYCSIKNRLEDLNQESRLCELILELIKYTETKMDCQVEMFDDILKTVDNVRQMQFDGTNFREQAIDKCSLLIYDSFAVLRSMRKKIIELAKTYHVPYFYDSDDSTIRLRASLLTTYKNLNIVMDDFSVLSEALWFVRHYNYFGPTEEDQPSQPQDQPAQSKTENSRSGRKPRLTPDWKSSAKSNSAGTTSSSGGGPSLTKW